MLYKKLPYDSECAIELFTVCNYRCSYCSGPRAKKLVRRGRTKADIESAIRFFNDSQKTWLIGMSGGEPTIHPFFGELVDGLKHKQYFYFFTNLSFDVERFMDLVPADRVCYIKASLHPEADIDTFLGKYETLFGFGYNPILIMVSAPDTFDRIAKVAEFCEKRQFPFNLSVMEGPYRDKNYPNDYTESEKAFIEKHTLEPGNLIRLLRKTAGGMNTFGLSCPAGSRSFVLDLETGDLRTCESVGSIHGNIYEENGQKTFSPYAQNIVCPAINGCVGYDRSPCLPDAYADFFSKGWNFWHLEDIKKDELYPENLFLTIKADQSGSLALIESALEAVHKRIESGKTLFWGAGIYGAKVVQGLMQKFGDSPGHIIGFVDSLKERQESSVLGLPVYSPQSPVLNEADMILITSYAFEEDIKAMASTLGIKTEVVALHRDILKPMGIKEAIF